MSWEQIKADWDRHSAQIQERWGRLTEEDLVLAQAGRNALVGCVRDRYGIDASLAERHVDGWIISLS